MYSVHTLYTVLNRRSISKDNCQSPLLDLLCLLPKLQLRKPAQHVYFSPPPVFWIQASASFGYLALMRIAEWLHLTNHDLTEQVIATNETCESTMINQNVPIKLSDPHAFICRQLFPISKQYNLMKSHTGDGSSRVRTTQCLSRAAGELYARFWVDARPPVPL